MTPRDHPGGVNPESTATPPAPTDGIRKLLARVASTLQAVVPFDSVELVLPANGDSVIAIHWQGGTSGEPTVREGGIRSHYSDRLWPAAGEPHRVLRNATVELDSRCEADRRLIQEGTRSICVLPLRADQGSDGLLVLSRSGEEPFDPVVAPMALAAAEFLSIAAEREQAWELHKLRQRRWERLEALVPTIAESLDVRQVFVALSSVIKEVLPHDVLAFALLSADRGGVRLRASTHQGLIDLPEYRFSNPEEALDANWRYLLAYDLALLDTTSLRARISPRHASQPMEVVVHPGPVWMRFVKEAGIRSTLRVPIRDKGKPIGGVAFLSSSADAYDEEDGLLASRIADLVALAIAHQQLSDEAARRSRLAALDTALPQLETLQDLDEIAVMVSRLTQGIVNHDGAGVAVAHSSGGHLHGILDGTHRVSMEATPEFMEIQFGEVFTSGSFLMRDLEVLDESKRLVRQHLLRGGAQIRRDVALNESEFGSVRSTGVRSELRVPVRQGKEMIGAVMFLSRQPDHFTEEDVIVVKRVAERLSLRLAQERIEGATRRASEASERARVLEQRVAFLQSELERFSPHRALGKSASWMEALALAAQVAGTDTTVLITGESGTGKEVIARYIHSGSRRSKGPFVALNCAALPEQLLESELFGRERGAYTGAVDSRPGKIEQAAGGVLFLDEVGEMSLTVQAKFLRVLQEREFQRLGGSKMIRADVRIVAATNRDPRAAIASGAFREDLYYRLGVFEIHLPPLRERPEDIMVLAEAFIAEVGESVGRPAAGLSEDAREQLLAHSWPGNVRELRNAIERAVILCQGGLITREHLPISISRPQAERAAAAAPAAAEFPVEGIALKSIEKDLLVKALEKAGNNKSRAAKLLGLSRGQFYSLLRRHGLTDARR